MMLLSFCTKFVCYFMGDVPTAQKI